MRGGGKGLGDERCPTYYRAAERSNFIHNLSFGPGSQFIAVKRNPNVLNTSGATTNSSSQSSGESSTSQDKGIGGPKFIALAAENSNLKNLVAEVRYKSFFSRRYGDCSTIFFYIERLRPEIQPLAILFTILTEKVPLSHAFTTGPYYEYITKKKKKSSCYFHVMHNKLNNTAMFEIF